MSATIAPSQIAERQIDTLKGKHVLVAGEAEDLFPIALTRECPSVTVFTTNYAYYSQLQTQATPDNLTLIFDNAIDTTIQADIVLLYWPKAKAEAAYLLAMLMAALGQDTEIMVVGETRSGVKSIEKLFAPYGRVSKHDSARRCALYWGLCTQQPAPFVLEDWYKTYTLTLADQQLVIKSLPGVFSHGEFDLGSQLLLDTLPALSGKVLDFGCGAGVIGTAIALSNPSVNIEMCDISALALASSRETLKANSVVGNVFPSNVYSDTGQDYQSIVSNPPFHAGLDTSYSATESLLASAPNHLKRNGDLYIVANSFLRYQPIITQAFGHCTILDKTSKFAIYHAKK